MALIKLLSDIFVPIIPALVAGGLLMALQNFLTAAGLFGPKSIEEMYPAIEGISSMIQLMSAAPFMFLPILVGISAAKRFGANQFLGAAIGFTNKLCLSSYSSFSSCLDIIYIRKILS